ncbi:hypothetical protein [Moraxella lacunata]|uniref:hypothetical protein n=1 Tax=Moraxella lacunata TaxID=477 RepID=UPI003EE0A45E
MPLFVLYKNRADVPIFIFSSLPISSIKQARQPDLSFYQTTKKISHYFRTYLRRTRLWHLQ